VDSILPELAFALFIAAWFVAVIAVQDQDCDDRAPLHLSRKRGGGASGTGTAYDARSSPRALISIHRNPL
jgi:hypothetical protein